MSYAKIYRTDVISCAVFYFQEVSMRNSKVTALADCAMMIALAFALSYATIYKMPLGGSVTVASMLPIMLLSIKYGPLIGTGAAFVYSLTQAFQAFLSGEVFPYCETGALVALCLIFDYIVPYTVLGLSGIFVRMRTFKNSEIAAYVGMGGAVFIRFLSHFFIGAAIWDQWAPEGMNKYLYSFLYNAGFLSVDFVICIAVAVFLLHKAEIRRLIGLEKLKSEM